MSPDGDIDEKDVGLPRSKDHSPFDQNMIQRRSMAMSQIKPQDEHDEESQDTPNKDLANSNAQMNHYSSSHTLAKLKLKQRNEALLAGIAQKRQLKADAELDKAKFMADKKARLREQVQKKNQEMIRQMNEAKAAKEE